MFPQLRSIGNCLEKVESRDNLLSQKQMRDPRLKVLNGNMILNRISHSFSQLSTIDNQRPILVMLEQD